MRRTSLYRLAVPCLLGHLLALQACVTILELPEAPALNRIQRLEDQRVDAEEIEPYLDDSSALVRHRAALAMARLRDPAALPLIISRLEVESDLRVAEMLIFALGRLESSSALKVLLVFESHSMEAIRVAAVEALGRLREPGVTPDLIERLAGDPSPLVRGEACLALARLGGQREKLSADLPADLLQRRTAALAERMLDDPNSEVRWMAAYALAEIQDAAAGPALLQAMEDSNIWVRTFAARGLGSIDPAPEIQETLIRFCGDPDWPVVVECIKALKRYNNATTAIKLIQLLSPGVTLNTHIRSTAAATLGHITNGGESAIKALKQATYDFSLAVEAEAIVALGAIGALANDYAFLDRIIRHQNPYLRLKAAEASILMKDDGVNYLLELAEDESIRVRCKALEGLKEYPQYQEEIIPLAEKALAINDLALHYAAAEVLGAFGAAASAPRLKAAYRMTETVEAAETRLKLLETILSLEGAADVDFLGEALQDRDFRVRQLAAETLSSLPGMVVYPEPEECTPAVTPIAGADYFNGRPNPVAHVFTEKGEFWIELFPDMAPHHVKSFIQMARRDEYDQLKFHRVVPNFVVQGLDPRGDGWGNGDRVFRDETNRVRFFRGIVGVPNAGPDTGGCQIFITVCAAPHLDGRFTAIGKVVAGMNVVDAIQVGDRVLRVAVDD